MQGDMSYAIVRNEKLTRDEAKGRYVHNERKTKGHTNKDIQTGAKHEKIEDLKK